MTLLAVDIEWWILLFLAIDIVAVFLLKTQKRFLLISVPLWALLLFTFISTIAHYNTVIQNLQSSYDTSFGGKNYGDHKIWMELWRTKSEAGKYSALTLHLLGIQTILTLILQVIGLNRTTIKNVYWRTMALFIFATIGYLVLEFLMTVVPKTGYVT